MMPFTRDDKKNNVVVIKCERTLIRVNLRQFINARCCQKVNSNEMGGGGGQLACTMETPSANPTKGKYRPANPKSSHLIIISISKKDVVQPSDYFSVQLIRIKQYLTILV